MQICHCNKSSERSFCGSKLLVNKGKMLVGEERLFLIRSRLFHSEVPMFAWTTIPQRQKRMTRGCISRAGGEKARRHLRDNAREERRAISLFAQKWSCNGQYRSSALRTKAVGQNSDSLDDHGPSHTGSEMSSPSVKWSSSTCGNQHKTLPSIGRL